MVLAVIMTTFPMPALARHRTAKESAIIASAVIMTILPMPALARHQTAEGLEIILIVMVPHPRENSNNYGRGQTGIPLLLLSPHIWTRKIRTSTHPATKSMHQRESGPKT
jgi:hypothetical protein